MYIHERNFGCRIKEYVWRGLRTITVENEVLRVTILADKGTDIVEFLHKPTDTDFLWRSPMGIVEPQVFVPTNMGRHESSFEDYYEGGWTECFPSGGVPCTYRGVRFGLHGEIALRPWSYTILEDNPDQVSLRFQTRTYRTPYLLQKIITLKRGMPVLEITETIVNEGQVTMEYVWGQHLTFGPPFLDDSCMVDIPATRVNAEQIAETSRCLTRDEQSWPIVTGRSGKPVDLSRILGPESRVYDMAFLSGMTGGWYAITNRQRGIGFGLVWPEDVFRAVWFWQVYGGALVPPWYGRTYNIGLEPWTTHHNSLEKALQHGTASVLEPGAAVTINLKALVYTGLTRVRKIEPTGEVIPA